MSASAVQAHVQIGMPAQPAASPPKADDAGFSHVDLASVLAAIKAGVAYANVRTLMWPAGEVRGQIGRSHGGDDD